MANNQTLLLILLFVVFISVIFFAIILFSTAKDKKKIAELEQRLLLSQMNPHFVFNSLTAIQSYIFRNEPYMAGKYLASFSKLVRLILENSRQEYIPIAKEKDTLNYYLELQALRFEEKFDFEIEIDEDIDMEHHIIPPMLAQPFIENAIEHGIIHMSDKGNIQIRFKLLGPSIMLEVEDNGIGIEKSLNQSNPKRANHQSLATKITKERIKNIRGTKGERVSLETIDLSTIPNSGKRGTLVRFTIPIITSS